MTERLDEYPEAFTDDDSEYPWSEDFKAVTINPFSNMRSFGRPLQSLKSEQLLAIRRECEKRNGRFGLYFGPLIVEIDELLMARGGEL